MNPALYIIDPEANTILHVSNDNPYHYARMIVCEQWCYFSQKSTLHLCNACVYSTYCMVGTSGQRVGTTSQRVGMTGKRVVITGEWVGTLRERVETSGGTKSTMNEAFKWSRDIAVNR